MPIPTRSIRDPQTGNGTKSKNSGARGHLRAFSTVVPDVKQVARTHARAVSSVKAGPTEQSTSSLLRKPSIRTDNTSTSRQQTIATHQTAKNNAAVTIPVSSSVVHTSSSLRQPTSKPQFTAYQQHFSPKKPPRPASIASDTPSNEGVNASHDTPVVARLRDEFLQLRLIHAGSQETLQRFETDAKTKLKSRFDAISKKNESVVALEQHRNRCISHMSLKKWLQQGDEISNDKLHRLASCLRDLGDFIAKDGQYSSLISQFQAWFEQMIIALDSRKQSTETISKTYLFVEPINALWLQDAAAIQRKLQDSRQELHDLGCADAGGISFVLNSYKRLADNLSQELESCVLIQKSALEQEEAWIAESLQELLEGEYSAERDTLSVCRKGTWEASVTDLG